MLFTEGLHKSDVVVLLCTEGLLTRPWCLLELYEARKHNIPVLPVVLSGRGFSMSDAHKLLAIGALRWVVAHQPLIMGELEVG